MLAMFTENGPYNWSYDPTRRRSHGDMNYNANSWNNKANVMYIDQPLGTGFSSPKNIFQYRWTEKQIAEDFKAFLIGFIEKYPQFINRDIYLMGESYAGHYIPSISNHLFFNPDERIKIAGLAIGNGWVDPFYQYPSYPVFAQSQEMIKDGHFYVLQAFYSICQVSLILDISLLSTVICTFAGVSIAPPLPSFNIYDIREPCVEFGLCYPDNHLT
jgi:cathepsin A (carboxypeptidase C)